MRTAKDRALREAIIKAIEGLPDLDELIRKWTAGKEAFGEEELMKYLAGIVVGRSLSRLGYRPEGDPNDLDTKWVRVQ